MRVTVAVAVVLLSACVNDRLNVDPPSGVDFTGKWKLNEADSDDPLHLLQSQNANNASRENNDGTGGARRSRRGGATGAGPGATYAGPPAPPIAAMNAPLRWPGKQLEVKQVAGVVAFTSEGRNRVCQPNSEKKHHPKADPHDRDSMPAARDSTPPVCGWSEASLIVKGGDEDDRAGYEEHYELSSDRQRLVETVVFLSGRSSGYTLSRVWDRVAP